MFKILVSAAIVGMASAAGNETDADGSCISHKTCDDCTGDCAWYEARTGLVAGKCGPATMGTLDKASFEIKAVCGDCDAHGCESCYGLTGCKWSTIPAVGGQCAKELPTAATEKSLDTCRAEAKSAATLATCESLKKCDVCESNENCGWFTDITADQKCSLGDGSDFGFASDWTKADTCGTCAASRCEECNGIEGCDWYAVELPLMGATVQRCDDEKTTVAHSKMETCPADDANGASGMQLSLAAIVATGVATLLA